jgi:LemA protein
MGYAVLGVCILVAIILYGWYASIITKRNGALEALSSVDVQLKQRLDLIPNILKIARSFMDHEKSLLEEITQLRTRAAAAYDPKDAKAVSEHLTTVDQLSSRMGQLMVNVENYPTLKSDATMVTAMQSYNEVEAQIAAARRFYNSAVSALNSSIQIFPGNILAGMAGVTGMPFYKAEEAVHASIDANAYLRP